MMNDLDYLLQTLYPWSYVFIGLGVMIENMGVPVPGETIMVASAILAVSGRLNPYLVIISGAAGAVIGDNIGYWLGRIGGRRIVNRLSLKFQYINKAVGSTEKFFKKYGGATVFFARFIAGVRIFAGPFAGLSLMDFKRFFIYNATGAIIWSCTVVLVISYLGKFYYTYVQDYEYANYVIYGIIFIILIYITYSIIKKLKNHA